MPKLSEKKGKLENGGVRVRAAGAGRKPKLPSEKQAVYHDLKLHGYDSKRAKEIALLGTNTNNVGTIEQQREKALKALNLTIESQFSTLIDIRDDKQNSCASDRIQAVKTINDMIPGFRAPAEVNVKNTGVFVEFLGLSGNELSELCSLLSVNNRDETRDSEAIEMMETEQNQYVTR